MDNKGSVMGWFIAGAVLGVGVGFLFASDRGNRTRNKLAETAGRSRKSLLESGQEIFERGRELYERGREIAEDAAELFERGRRIAEKQIDERV